MALDNLGYNVTNGVVAAGVGTGLSALSHLANRAISGSSHAMRFFWNRDLGAGGVVRVMAGQIAHSMMANAAEAGIAELEKLLYKKERELLRKRHEGGNFTKLIEQGVANTEEKYGKIDVKGGGTVVAVDPYGNKCVDALMLKIPTKKNHTYSPRNHENQQDTSPVSSTDLVWWDCTAIITINSEKNLILTKVQGRDYTRKELVSNGDINFSVSGHILSPVPDVYPAQEVQKFTEIMQYKGWVYINNEVLDQFNIKKIVIKDFNINHQEGNKANVTYSFNAVGVMPEKEIDIDGDSIQLLDSYLNKKFEETDNKWKKLLEKQIDTLKGAAVDTAKDVAATGIGMAEDQLINKMLD